MKKRLLLIGMILAMSVSVSACGSEPAQAPEQTQEVQEQEAPAATETRVDIGENVSDEAVAYLDDLARQLIIDNNCDFDMDGDVISYTIVNFEDDGYYSLYVDISDETGQHAKTLRLYSDLDDNIHYFQCVGETYIDDGVVD